MENNNGKGIFYGVIGVATLVVAIIGATFAFFSATATGANADAVAANSVNLSGTLTITDSRDSRNEMIPVTEEIMYTSYALEDENHCKGYSVTSTGANAPKYDLCSTYDFTITNGATVDQTVYYTLSSTLNSFGSGNGTGGHLMYCMFHKDDVATAKELTADNCSVVPNQGAQDKDIFNEVVPAGGSKSYTIILFIKETPGSDQTEADSGKAYTGTISATTSGDNQGVTGVITGLS